MFIPKITSKNIDLFEVWVPYWEWEEVSANMWGSTENKKQLLNEAIKFTGNHELYGEWMMKVVNFWPISCKHHLSKNGDKRSWIGHAACAMAFNCPEEIVRLAWGKLTIEQQQKANEKAQKAIDFWRKKNA
jgi:hypothetical protein